MWKPSTRALPSSALRIPGPCPPRRISPPFTRRPGVWRPTDSTSGFSDPIVTYDDQIQRFIVGDQDVDFNTHNSTFDVAVSTTDSPTDLTTSSWNFFQINTTENGGTANTSWDADYPGNFGYNADAFVFTLNMFSDGSQGDHVQVVSVSSSDLASGVANPATYHNDYDGFSLRPTAEQDAKPGDPEYLIEEGGDGTSINVVSMTNVLSSSASFATTNLSVNPYSPANPPLQPDGSAITYEHRFAHHQRGGDERHHRRRPYGRRQWDRGRRPSGTKSTSRVPRPP